MKTIANEIPQARILVVDDQVTNVSLLEAFLADAGFRQVTSTTDPHRVCALHREQQFDLILLDLQMPGMDGFQVMEALKADAVDDYLPVLVITAQPGHKLRALQAGAKDFVSKPFDLVELNTRIHNMLEVRLLYKRLAQFNAVLERTVQERTAELRESEARYRSLTRLASDWYWEQDEDGRFTQVSGPVLEMLGLPQPQQGAPAAAAVDGWNDAEREQLRARIAAREPFLDFVFSRAGGDGARQQYRVSGEPMFNHNARFVGYRGIGVEVFSGVDAGGAG